MNEPVPIQIPNHKGILRQCRYPFQEKGDPSQALDACDIVFDLQNNVYTAWGFSSFGTPIGTPANVSSVFYSEVADQILILEGASLKVVNPVTGATVHTFTSAFTSGATLSYADWFPTTVVYITDGSTGLFRYDPNAVTLTSISLGSGVTVTGPIAAWQDILWLSSGVTLFPSTINTPETFSSLTSLTLSEDGPQINALVSTDNALFAHKDGTIYVITGTSIANFAERNLKTGQGAVGVYAAVNYEGVQYFISKNGFCEFDGRNLQSIQLPITTLINAKIDLPTNFGAGYSLQSAQCYVLPLVPIWPPDFGRKYILFLAKYSGVYTPQVWRYDMQSGDWCQLFRHVTFNVTGFAYSTQRVKTYVTVSNSTGIFRFQECDNYGGSPIVGEYVTGQIDGGLRHVAKSFEYLNLHPVSPGGTYSLDIDGLNIYGYDIKNPDLSEPLQTGFNMPFDAQTYMASILARKQGGLQPLLSGLTTMLVPLPITENRSYAASKKDNVLATMLYGNKPWIAGAFVAAGGETTATITHNLGFVPQAILLGYQGSSLSHPLSVNPGPGINSFVINVNGTLTAGDKVYYLILKRGPIILNDAQLNGGLINIPSGAASVTLEHGLIGNPLFFLTQVK